MKKMNVKVLCLLLAALLLAGCTVTPDATDPAVLDEVTEPTQPIRETVADETVPVTEPADSEDLAIETPVGVLLYPAELAEYLDVRTTEGDKTVMTFLAVPEDREQALFDLWFSRTTAEGAAGAVQAEGKPVYMGIDVHDFVPDDSWQQEQIDLVYAMQEALNVLLDQVTLTPVEDVPVQTDLAIATAYGDLHFPAKWEDRLVIEKPDNETVEFYGVLSGKEPQLLFTVRFGGESAMSVTAPDGTRTAVDFVFTEPVFGSGWSQEEMDLIYAMQEDINYLIDALAQ